MFKKILSFTLKQLPTFMIIFFGSYLGSLASNDVISITFAITSIFLLAIIITFVTAVIDYKLKKYNKLK